MVYLFIAQVKQKEIGAEYDLEPGALSHQETLDALSEMYRYKLHSAFV